MSARYAGIDYGTKRVGIAISDPLGTIASPLVTLTRVGGPAEQARDILAAVGEFDIDEWVVGLPLNMDGTEGPQAKLSDRFAKLIATETGAPVHLWDERLSSVQADMYLAAGDLTNQQKKARRDKLAAQIILQSFLDARTTGD